MARRNSRKLLTYGLTHLAIGVKADLFARDPDGYLFEIWYEIPTRVDP